MKFDHVLRLGDSTLVLSQRLSEWCGRGPALEEDMALSNVALDLLGQSRMWLTYAGELEGQGRSEDQLAFLRDAHEFRNALLVEQPGANYADVLVRQFFFDTWHHLTLETLISSGDERIAGIADKALKEVRYHLRRSNDLVMRLGDGSAESHRRMQAAVDDLWMFTGDLFDEANFTVDMDISAINAATDVRAAWLNHVTNVLDQATLRAPSQDAWMQEGSRQGQHGEAFGYLLAEMQFLQRAYPGAQW